MSLRVPRRRRAAVERRVLEQAGLQPAADSHVHTGGAAAGPHREVNVSRASRFRAAAAPRNGRGGSSPCFSATAAWPAACPPHDEVSQRVVANRPVTATGAPDHTCTYVLYINNRGGGAHLCPA